MGVTSDLSTVLEPAPFVETKTRSRSLARIVSIVFSPPLMCLAVVLYVAMTGEPHPAAWRVSVYVFACIILPVVYLLHLLKRGEISDFHICRRQERIKPMAVMLLSTAAGWIFLLFTRRGYDLLSFIAGVALAQYAVLFTVTLFWKISAHAAASTTLALLLALTQGTYMLPVLVLIPLVIWARVILKKHTLPQALAGSFTGVLFTLLALHMIASVCVLRGLVCPA